MTEATPRKEPDSDARVDGRWSAFSWSAGASLVAGLGALGFLTVGRFVVGLAEFAPVAHVWTVWSMSAATVGFGAQVETVEALASERAPISKRHLRLVFVAALLIWVVTFLWRESLFGSAALFWPVVCTIIPFGSLTTGVARGLLAAQGRERRLAFVIAGENAVRFSVSLVLLVLGAGSPMLAMALLLGFGVALAGLVDLSGSVPSNSLDARSSGSVGAFAGLVAHSSLVLPPMVLAFQGQSPEVVAAIFLVLTYLRAPYQFLLGLGPHLTAHSYAVQTAGRESWFSEGGKVAKIAILSMAIAAVGGFLGGDLASTLILGGTDLVEPIDYAMLGALVCGIALSILRTIYLLPTGEGRLVMRAWATAAIAGVASALLTGEPTLLFAGLLFGVSVGMAQLTLGSGARGRR